jgi:hypothetical protein
MAGKSTSWDAQAGVEMLSEMLADESYHDPDETLLVALTRLDLAIVRFAMCSLAANIENERMDEYVLHFFDRIEELIGAQKSGT